MGDRCSLWIVCKIADREKVCQQLIGTDDPNTEDWPYYDRQDLTYLSFDEINYGGQDDREALAKAGLVFVGYQEEGGDYPACEFASDGTTHDYQDTLQGSVVLPVNALTLEIDPEDLAEARRYCEVRRRACEILQLDPGTFRPPEPVAQA